MNRGRWCIRWCITRCIRCVGIGLGHGGVPFLSKRVKSVSDRSEWETCREWNLEGCQVLGVGVGEVDGVHSGCQKEKNE